MHVQYLLVTNLHTSHKSEADQTRFFWKQENVKFIKCIKPEMRHKKKKNNYKKVIMC